MRKALALSIALSVGLGLGQVMAEDAQTQVPNLVGTWTSPVKLKWMRAKGTAEGSLTLRVLDQDGPLLKLEKSRETPGAAGNVGGKDVEKATETMVGVVDFRREKLLSRRAGRQRLLYRAAHGSRHAGARLC